MIHSLEVTTDTFGNPEWDRSRGPSVSVRRYTISTAIARNAGLTTLCPGLGDCHGITLPPLQE
jgi:hypothetical protein